MTGDSAVPSPFAPPLMRLAGAGLDAAFYYIILLPPQFVAIDQCFRRGVMWPAVAFLLFYFALLLLGLRRGGLTPGGLVLGYRVLDADRRRLSWAAALTRLSPYMLIEAVKLVWLRSVLTKFQATDQPFALAKMKAVFDQHGGMWNRIVLGLSLFLIFDVARVFITPRRQSLADQWSRALAFPQRSE